MSPNRGEDGIDSAGHRLIMVDLKLCAAYKQVP